MTNTAWPYFIAFASSKGGVGKSTTCAALAGALCHHGYPVHIIDFDQTETLYRWYHTNEAARTIPGLTLEKGPTDPAAFHAFILETVRSKQGFVLADLAGALTGHMLKLAAFSPLTITPAKLSEPDILEAMKLHEQLLEVARHAQGRVANHRVLVNEVSHVRSAAQNHMLASLDGAVLQRFETMIYSRAAYSEMYLTGLPPHFNADQERPATKKAVEELEYLLQEVFNALQQDQQQKAAA